MHGKLEAEDHRSAAGEWPYGKFSQSSFPAALAAPASLPRTVMWESNPLFYQWLITRSWRIIRVLNQPMRRTGPAKSRTTAGLIQSVSIQFLVSHRIAPGEM